MFNTEFLDTLRVSIFEYPQGGAGIYFKRRYSRIWHGFQ